MSTTNTQLAGYETQCCIGHCQRSFYVSGRKITNKYKCNQEPYYVAGIWSVQKSRKEVSIRTNLL